MQLEFFGAAGEVTGSCHILRTGNHQILLDCGLIQGSPRHEARNRDPFPFAADNIDAVVLSHAHIDHSGRLPLLVKRGFKGPIYTQNASRDLAEILLKDSAYINEREAEYENRRRERKGLEPIESLYTSADADNALARFKGMRYEEVFEVVPGVQVLFHDAGHIMGSAVVEVNVEANKVKRTLIFSGDLGQFDAPILRDPSLIEHADIVLSESTYGNRVHRDRAHTVAEIGEIIKDAQAHKGNILIPAFAVGRSQEVLYMFGRHYDEWDLDRWHVFLDSPLAIEASHIYWDYPHLYDGEATKLRRNIDVLPDKPRNLHLTKSAEESMVINKIHSGGIIIAGSGMCNGGRILHHLKHNAWRRECHIIIVGYQAQGSLGRRLVDRKKFIKIHGETIRVKARVHTVGGLSAHGDQTDLMRWYSGFKNKPPLYLVHGEPESAAAYSEKLRADFNAEVHIPQTGTKVDLTQLN